MSELALEIEKGATFTQCSALNGSKWHIGHRTFIRYWKEAITTYSERQQSIQNELLIQSTEASKERLKLAILTKDERMEIASKIAKGEAWRVDDTVIIPNGSDRMKALDYLSKIEGDFAAVKQELKIEEKGVDSFLLEE